MENIDETWKRLSSALREIQNHNASKLSYEALYRYSYDMVLYHSEHSRKTEVTAVSDLAS